MVRVLLKSDFFKSEEIRYKRVKSPAELVAGVLRLSGHLDRPRRDILEHFLKMDYMGQMLQNPPSVEGWHEGDEWIETGALLERVNFAAEQLGNPNMPGVARMIEDVLSGDDVEIDDLPQSCLRQLGEVEVTEKVMGILRETTAADDDVNNLNAGSVIRLIAASPDFQKC